MPVTVTEALKKVAAEGKSELHVSVVPVTAKGDGRLLSFSEISLVTSLIASIEVCLAACGAAFRSALKRSAADSKRSYPSK
jgi:hypothetical protein